MTNPRARPGLRSLRYLRDLSTTASWRSCYRVCVSNKFLTYYLAVGHVILMEGIMGMVGNMMCNVMGSRHLMGLFADFCVVTINDGLLNGIFWEEKVGK